MEFWLELGVLLGAPFFVVDRAVFLLAGIWGLLIGLGGALEVFRGCSGFSRSFGGFCWVFGRVCESFGVVFWEGEWGSQLRKARGGRSGTENLTHLAEPKGVGGEKEVQK